MPHCMVPGCTNGSRKTRDSNVSYHRLPSDKQMQKTWLARVRRDNIPKPNSCYVCSAHFTGDCFETSLKETFNISTKKTLKPGSIPSIFSFSHDRPTVRLISQKREKIREKKSREEVGCKCKCIAYSKKQQTIIGS